MECQESAALPAACRAAYRAVLPILSRAAASRTFSPLAMCSLARCNLSAVMTGLRPPFRPRAAAAVNPALVRSRIRSLAQCPEYVEDEPTARRGGVNTFGQRTEPDSARFQSADDLYGVVSEFGKYRTLSLSHGRFAHKRSFSRSHLEKANRASSGLVLLAPMRF